MYQYRKPLSRKKMGSSEKLLHAPLITQISKDDYADFHDFSKCFVSV
jgi:hypothetical protein